MGYNLKYRLEFDTIKGRDVRLDIEESRNLPPANETFAGYSFYQLNGNNTIRISNLSNIDNLPNYIYPNDKLTITGTSSNNSVFTVISYELKIIDGDYYVDIIVSEPVVFEIGFTITVVVTIPTDIIFLTPSSQSPVELSYPNGEFDKMCSIRESKMRIKILSDIVTFQDFIVTSDTQFKVKLYINGNLEWLGWLDNDYVTEPFLDFANEIELSANDGLSFLKTQPLQSQTGELWGIYSLDTYIASCLSFTNLDLDFYTIINVFPENEEERESNNQWKDAFSYANISSNSFLNGSTDFQDCYQVLSKIMQAFGCTLFQARGVWYIIQTNDRVANFVEGTIKDNLGDPYSKLVDDSYKINIGLNDATKLINADALISVQKPFKYCALKYSFDTPAFYFRNFDLLDGEIINSMSTNQKIYYSVLNWNNTLESATQSAYNLVNAGFIVAEIDSSQTNIIEQETLRYLALEADWDESYYSAKRTTETPVSVNDKINFKYRVRYTHPVLRNGGNYVKIILDNKAGQKRYLDNSGNWSTSFEAWVGVTYQQFTSRLFPAYFEITSKEIPFNGFISIQFSSWTEIGASPITPFEVHYIDMKFDVSNAFNQRTIVIGQENKCENNFNLKNTYDNEIFLSNSLRVSNIGGLLSYDGTLPPTIQNLWKYKGEDETLMPFNKYMTRAYWRTMYRPFLRLEGRLYDLWQGSRLLSPLNTVEFTDIEDKEFMITTLTMDLRNEMSEFTMIELRSTLNNSDFTENGIESFKYITEGTRDKDNPATAPKQLLDYKYGTYGYVQGLLNRDKKRRFNNF